MEISNWFKGFEKGIARLSPEERSAFFSECGKSCVNGGTLSVYRRLYEEAKGNIDVFFQMANDLPGVKGEVLFCRLSFPSVCRIRIGKAMLGHCSNRKGCFLRFAIGCIHWMQPSPLLCECSRQSVIYSLHTLWRDKNFTVTLCHSILGDGTDCEMEVKVEVKMGVKMEVKKDDSIPN